MDTFTRKTVESYRHEVLERHLDREYEYAFADAAEAFCDRVDDGDRTRPWILDVGCGGGEGVDWLTDEGYRVFGIDLTPELLSAARDRAHGHADIARMDMRTLAYRDDVFDALWASASVYHVPRDDAPQTVAGFHRVLRSGAPLCCSVPKGEGTETFDDGRRATLWPPSDFQRLFQEAEFTVDTVDTAGQWIFIHATA